MQETSEAKGLTLHAAQWRTLTAIDGKDEPVRQAAPQGHLGVINRTF